MLVAVAEPIQAPVMLTPGALISTHVPKLEKLAFASVKLVAPTVIALGALAGDLVQASLFSFPAVQHDDAQREPAQSLPDPALFSLNRRRYPDGPLA